VKTVKQLDIEIVSTKADIKMREAHLRTLTEAKRELESKAFIAANKLTLNDIELSSGDDKELFWHIEKFVDWLSANSTKRFAEWNTIIYFQSDLKAHRMPDMPVRLADLEGVEE